MSNNLRRKPNLVGIILFLIAFLTFSSLLQADGELRPATEEEKSFHRRMLSAIITVVPSGPTNWDTMRQTTYEELEYMGAPAVFGVKPMPMTVSYYARWEDTVKKELAQSKINEALEKAAEKDFQLQTEASETVMSKQEAYEKEMLSLIEKITVATEKNDFAALEQIGKEIELLEKKYLVEDGPSFYEQEKERILREMSPHDLSLSLNIEVNSFQTLDWGSPLKVESPIASLQVYRSAGKNIPEWQEGITYICLGKGWKLVQNGESNYLEATPNPNLPLTVAQTILVSVQGDQKRVRPFIEKIDWNTLKSLIQ
ncbi:MAG TPA: hypothetical protein DDW93_12965 [Firmicutes bacterium]|jgi:hypothetical protein|nr:hypothetical protein [Bacillota bacterium]